MIVIATAAAAINMVEYRLIEDGELLILCFVCDEYYTLMNQFEPYCCSFFFWLALLCCRNESPSIQVIQAVVDSDSILDSWLVM